MRQLPSDFELVDIRTAADVDRWVRAFSLAYQSVFSGAPYFEAFRQEEAEAWFRQLTSQPGQITLLAVLDGEMAGYGVAIPLKHKHDVARELAGLVPLAHTAYLAELGVESNFRGQGLGVSLTRERLRRIDNACYSHVVLRISEENSTPRAMYEAMSFTDMGVSMDVKSKRIDGSLRADRRRFLARVLSQVEIDVDVRNDD